MGISAEAIWGFAEILNREVDSRDDVSNAMVTRIDVDGKAWVRLDGASMDTPANGGTRVTISPNDAVFVTIKNGVCTITNNRSYPNATASDIGTVNVSVNQLDEKTMQNFAAVNGVIQNLEVDTAKIHSLTGDQLAFTVGIFDELTAEELDATKMTAIVGFFTDLTVEKEITAEKISATTGFYDTLTANEVDADKVTAVAGFYDTLNADNVDAGKVVAGIGFYDTLNANNVDANTVIAGAGYYNTLTANDVTAANIIASTEYVNDLTANHVTAGDLVATKATVDDLDANYAHITNGKIDRATIDYASVENLAAHYADIDLANVNNAWIANGLVKDASISDAKIIGVSANKLTAGTIDAANIRVIHLSASDITVGTLNGERIGSGSLSLDKLSERVYTEDEVDDMLDALNARIDSAIQTWTGNAVPLLTNYPASDWTTNAIRSEHIGDLYYVVNSGSQADGYSYRFVYDRTNDAYSWVLIQDSAITDALQRILDLEGDMSNVQTFVSDTASWIDTTDSSIESVMTSQTQMQTVINGTLDGQVQLWRTTPTSTAPAKPTTTTDTNWTINVPAYNGAKPYYWYCWRSKRTDGTFEWSDPILDTAITDSQSTSKNAITQLATKVDTSTFNVVKQTVDENSAAITRVTNVVETKADGSEVQSLTNTVNTVRQTVEENTSTISSLNDTVEDGIRRISEAETAIRQNSEGIELAATKTEVEQAAAYAAGLLYDHTYTETDGVYTFTAYVMKGMKDVTDQFIPDMFVWYLRTETGDQLYSTGTSITIDEELAGYHGTIIGGLEEVWDGVLSDDNDNYITTETGALISMYSEWEVA